MASVLTCRVHPVVLFTAVDSYERRSTKKGASDKAIGALLGSYERGVVNVSNCYAVPFSEQDNTPHLDQSFIDTMFEMLQKTSPLELPVGWYTTNPHLDENCIAFHDFFLKFVEKWHRSKDAQPVVLLTVDAAMESGSMDVRAFLKTTAGIPGKESPHCVIFNPIRVLTESHPAEEVALHSVHHGTLNPRREIQLTGGMRELEGSVQQMQTWLANFQRYIQEVNSGKRLPDARTGRELMKLVACSTHMSSKQFESLINQGMRDHLMVAYLAQLTQTQLQLYETMLKR